MDAKFVATRLPFGTLIYRTSGKGFREIQPESVQADEVRYRQEAAAERRAFHRTLGIDPWKGKYPSDPR